MDRQRMEAQYEDMFRFVEAQLTQSGKNVRVKEGVAYPFRKRSEHTRRVWVWAKRLMEGRTDLDTEAVNVAAIFHDVGYAFVQDKEDHAEKSAALCRLYLSEKNYEAVFVDSVAFLVANHSRKELLRQPDTSAELAVLMEADLLDETGAMLILWDCMMEGAESAQSYEKAYRRIAEYAAQEMAENPMVSPLARAYWEHKQRLMREFMGQLSLDLALNEPYGISE